MRTRIVFLTIGDDDELHQQCFIALLSCMGQVQTSAVDWVVITDRPQRYRFFGERVDVFAPDADTLRRWRGPHELFSRIKIEALLELERSRGPAHTLCLDSDILARRPLDDLLARIAGGELFMHRIEYRWCRPRSPRQKKVWQHLAGKRYAEHLVDESVVMWNAGVQGLPWEDRAVLDKELAVYDAFSEDGLFKLRHTTQQHTISLVMQRHAALQPAEDWFVHYWGNKHGHMPAIRERLAHILAAGLDVDQAARYVIDQAIELPELCKDRWWHHVLRRLLPY